MKLNLALALLPFAAAGHYEVPHNSTLPGTATGTGTASFSDPRPTYARRGLGEHGNDSNVTHGLLKVPHRYAVPYNSTISGTGTAASTGFHGESTPVHAHHPRGYGKHGNDSNVTEIANPYYHAPHNSTSSASVTGSRPGLATPSIHARNDAGNAA